MPTMQTRNPVSSANLMGHPLHPILITLPIGLFAGLIGAALAAVTGLIDFLGGPCSTSSRHSAEACSVLR